MTVLLTLQEAADAEPSEHVTKGLLYRERDAGRLRAWFVGGTICTSAGDMDDWKKLCRDQSSRPAFTSAKADPPAGSSATAPARSAQATAQSVAKMLTNCGKPSANTSPAASRPHHLRLPQIV